LVCPKRPNSAKVSRQVHIAGCIGDNRPALIIRRSAGPRRPKWIAIVIVLHQKMSLPP
jgi:hypothetical protein